MTTTPAKPPLWEVVDTRTQAVVFTCRSRKRAYNRADRLDAEYGAVRYSVRPI